jgi:hypothetical protein
MEEEDPNFVPDESTEHSPPARNLRRRPAEDVEGLEEQESAGKRARNSLKRGYVVLPQNLRTLVPLKAKIVKKLHGQDYDEATSLRIVHAGRHCQIAHTPGRSLRVELSHERPR